MTQISHGARAASDALDVVATFAERFIGQDTVGADFTFGNPHEAPLAGLTTAIQSAAVPRSNDWFAYKSSVAEAQAAVAEALSGELGLPFAAEDITMTQGAFGAIALAFDLLLNPGDEVIHPKPGWFAYTPVLAARGYGARHVALTPGTYDLDLEAIDRAITPRTRIVVVNSPHNPTGRIYSREALQALADLLERASARIGHRIFILSDEPYRRIRYAGQGFTSPAEVYPHTLIDYSYGKILLAPGQRIGYLALGPLMDAAERAALRDGIFPSQVALGWGFPDATMQYAIPELETLSMDLGALTARKDRLLNALRQWGYEIVEPQGTFYLWGRAPGGDSVAFAEKLAERDVFVMPGTLFDCPEDFRICLTATSEMIEMALPAFAEAAA